MGNHLTLIFPRHDMDCAIEMKDNGVNEAISQGLAVMLSRELCKAFSVFIQRSSYNKSRKKEIPSENSMLEC